MDPTLDALQTLDLPPVTLAALTVATLALVASEPVLGRRHHRRFLAEVAADPSGGEPVRLRHHRRWAGLGRLWAAAAVGLLAALGGLMAGLHLGTGSLLVPMLLHALVDLRPLVLTARTRPARTAYAPAPGSGVQA